MTYANYHAVQQVIDMLNYYIPHCMSHTTCKWNSLHKYRPTHIPYILICCPSADIMYIMQLHCNFNGK